MKYEPMEEDEVEPELGEADQVQHEAFDRYITARVNLSQGDSKAYGTVMGRKRDANGKLVGISHENPLLDTAIYEVQFDSGDVEEYSANIIAESIYAQVDDDGTTYLLNEIIDHRKSRDAMKAMMKQFSNKVPSSTGLHKVGNYVLSGMMTPLLGSP